MDWYTIFNLPLNTVVPLPIMIVFSFIFGSCLGSFLNVCIWRIPLGESVVVVPSHCPKCNHKIRWYDNVPVIGFLALGGKCRDCKAKISPRYIIMEILVGVLFTLLALALWFAGRRVAGLAAITIMLSVAVPCAFIDAEYRKIPDKLTFFGMISSVIYLWGFPFGGRISTPQSSLLWSLAGLAAGIIGLGLFAWLTGKLMRKRTLGAGDVKYAGFLGALFGIPGLLVTLCLASFLAIIGFTVLKMCKKASDDNTVAFAPYLGIAAYIWMAAMILLPFFKLPLK